MSSLLRPASPEWSARFLALFRVVAGLIFITNGTMKVFGVPAGPPEMPAFSPFTQMGIGGILEVLGGTLIVVGLLVRPTAFVLAGMMAVAYWQFHAPSGFWPTGNGGIPAILYCFLFLYLMVEGGGAFTIDALLAGRGEGRGDGRVEGRRAA